MRYSIAIILIVLLVACTSAPKDYTGAKELKPIKSQLKIESLWVKRTGGVPVYAHAQLQPTIVGDRIYIASVKGDVRLMDVKNGDVLWSTALKENLTSAPGVGEESIFVGSRNAEIIALDKKHGNEKWRASVASEMLATPLVVGSTLFVQTIDGKVTSLDAQTGKLIWSYSHDIPKLTLRGTASPIADGDQIIAGFADGNLVSLNARNGELNWKATITVPRGRTDLERLADIDGLFQAADGSVYVTSYQGRIASVSLADGSIQWARNLSSYTGLTVNSGRLYVTDSEGQVWSLDARTGATLWRQDNLTGREITTPVVIGTTVVVADYEGYAHWLSVEDGRFVARKSLNEVWYNINEPDYDSFYEDTENKLFPRVVTASPLASNNTLFVRDNTGAFAAFLVKSETH